MLFKAASIDQVMIIVSEYSSFFNYRLIERIIKSLGTKEDKAKLAEYEQDFEKYATRTVYECPPEIGLAHSKDRLPLVIKVHHQGFEECSLRHLEQFVIKVSEILELPIGMLLLESVIPGCLELTLQLPLVVHQTIFPLSTQQEEALAALGVTKISASDYQYPSYRDEGDIDHKPDDKPDDEPSDSGFDTLTTVLSELSQLKQDMIDRDIHVTNPYELDFDHNTDSVPVSPDLSELKKGIIDGDVSNRYEIGFDQKIVIGSNGKSSSGKNGSVTPLHVAAYHGRLDLVKALCGAKQFSPLQKDQRGNTALHYAAQGHHLEVLKYFVEEQGCNPTMPGAFDETPLHVAARHGHLDTVKYLVLEQGVDPMCQEGDCDGTPLHSACIGGNFEVVRFLVSEFNKYLNTKEFVNDETIDGVTSLHLAAYYGHLEIVKHLVSEMNCDPNAPNDDGFTALHAAAHEGNIEIMKYLTGNAKCNPMPLTGFGVTPLHMAAGKGHLEAVKFLTLIKHCNPLCRDIVGYTPLHKAAAFGRLNVVKFLIEKLNCPPDVPAGPFSAIPMKAAAQKGHHNVVKYLQTAVLVKSGINFYEKYFQLNFSPSV